MKASVHIMKPKNWQDFEKLCKLLWGEIWDCDDTIKQHGRQGQAQQGVDVYAHVDKYGGYCGIQCKGKDDYTHAQLTKVEIDAEIAKAKDFRPFLKRFIFATTANKDAKIESYIREKDIECHSQGLFHVDIFSWEDIVDLLERYRTPYNWYINNCQFKEATRVDVVFSNGKSDVTIRPEYVRTTRRYQLRKTPSSLTVFDALEQAVRLTTNQFQLPTISHFHDVLNPPQKIDKRWSRLSIRLVNSGNTIIRTPKLQILFCAEDIENLSDGFSTFNHVLMDQAAVAAINTRKHANREVFKKYLNMVEFKPKEQVFVQTDERSFSISIIPRQGVSKFSLYWKFLCEDFQQGGEMSVFVEPIVEDKLEFITVDLEEELLPDEVTITPKVIESY